MADLTKRIICIILYWISQTQLISADEPYCEWGTCGKNEYCCQTNECCKKNIGSFYILILLWLVITVILGVLALCIYRHKYHLCRMSLSHPEEKPIIA